MCAISVPEKNTTYYFALRLQQLTAEMKSIPTVATNKQCYWIIPDSDQDLENSLWASNVLFVDILINPVVNSI